MSPGPPQLSDTSDQLATAGPPRFNNVMCWTHMHFSLRNGTYPLRFPSMLTVIPCACQFNVNEMRSHLENCSVPSETHNDVSRPTHHCNCKSSSGSAWAYM